jgi:hypothetical protein
MENLNAVRKDNIFAFLVIQKKVDTHRVRVRIFKVAEFYLVFASYRGVYYITAVCGIGIIVFIGIQDFATAYKQEQIDLFRCADTLKKIRVVPELLQRVYKH